jgi:predicted ATPase
LRLRGETVVEVPPLSCEGGRTSDAVALFVERARAVRPGLELRPDDIELVARFVQAVEGLPLAIELAAARLSVLTATEILALLPRRFELLARGERGAPSRRRSLREAIDWSWELLRPYEQSALGQCAAFHGGFDRRAADAVIDLSEFADAPWTTDVLSALRDKSFLVTRAVSADEIRFGMYVSIRDYALEKLRAAAGLEATRTRHARYYIDRAQEYAALLRGEGGRKPLERLLADVDNLVAIEDEALSDEGRGRRERLSLALEAARALEPIFDFRGPVDAQLARLDALLEHPLADGWTEGAGLLAQTRRIRGKLRRMRGLVAQAKDDLDAALAFAQHRGDAALEADVWIELAFVHRGAGRMPEARVACETGLALARKVGARGAEGVALYLLGIIRHSQGAWTDAMPLYEGALLIHGENGDRRSAGITFAVIGFLCQDLGQLEEAETYYRRALAMHQELGNRRAEAVVLGYLGNLQRRKGAAAQALEHYDAAIAALTEQGDEQFVGVFHMDAGIMLRDHDRDDEAAHRFDEAVVHLGRAGDERCHGYVLALLGALAADAGNTKEAEGRLSDAKRMLERCGDTLFSKVVPILEGHLDVAGARAARLEGDDSDAERRLERARARAGTGDASGLGTIEGSEHAYFARRLLRRALDRADPPRDAFVVATDAAWFRPARGAHVDLSSRPPLRRIVAALADARERSPGKALPIAALFAAGWPGERIQRAAMHNRVRVALTTLRKLGLASALARAAEGYLLDPNTPLVRTDAPPRPS